ncbi:MAG: hypothetical protein XD69_1207 [Clostridia bacterium 62_21]|nr:MAG: hypothetical protein XD69_1207 [Clostridia bacterium 62_21]HAG07910.1 DUF192 domain-containing protein [Peptococcaceae bacterium]
MTDGRGCLACRPGGAYALVNVTKDTLLAGRLVVAGRFWRRMVGLLGSRELPAGTGLLLTPCSAVHTMFMRYAIDVLFLAEDFSVLKAVAGLKPWRTAVCRGAAMVVELPPGTVAQTGTGAGDKLALRLEACRD